MTPVLQQRFRSVGQSARLETVVYRTAGHEICGDGMFPSWVCHKDDIGADAIDFDAEGAGEIESFER